MGEIMSKIRQLSAHVANMVEIQKGHTRDIAKIEARLCALEGAVRDDEGDLPKKPAASSKMSPNDHPVLKVSRCCLLAMIVQGMKLL